MRSIRKANVAVIGGAGFLGSHLVNHLIEDRGCEVLVIDNLVAGRREFVHPKARFEHHDITLSEGHLHRLFVYYKVQFVFNYAAIPFVPLGFSDPITTFRVTAVGTLNVMKACEDAKVEGLLQVSSAEIYGGLHGQIREDCETIPHSTYGVSKLAADHLVQARWREVGFKSIAMRQFNCYGPRPTWPYVIPEIITQLQKGSEVRLGNNSCRDFQYALDAVKMSTELLEKGEWGQVYNMGSNESIRIYDLARLIGKLMGHPSINIVVDETRVRKKDVEIWELCSDSSKLYSVIESRPMTNLEDGLRETIAWHAEHDYFWRGGLSGQVQRTSRD